MENRTDLALESYENQRKTALPGVKVREQDGISVVEVLDARGEKALGKPVGKYITYRVSPMAQETQLFDGRLERIADLLRGLLPDHPTGVLVAGVGNTAITADALGPETNRYVLATRHIAGELRRALGPLTDVSTVTTGVLGNTGMESAEVVAGMVHTVHPDCVLVVDALAASSADRLGTTVQLSNAGIAPGSGVGNHRREISARDAGRAGGGTGYSHGGQQSGVGRYGGGDVCDPQRDRPADQPGRQAAGYVHQCVPPAALAAPGSVHAGGIIRRGRAYSYMRIEAGRSQRSWI